MKRVLVLTFSAVIFHSVPYSQDFSNKGKDFWVGYGSHSRMYEPNGTVVADGGTQDMVLYITSTYNTNFRVEIPGNGWSYTGSVAANAVATTIALPKSGSQDARLYNEGKFNRGIHVTSDYPVVAYVHIYNQSISGAGVLFPTNTLGKEYYSINYTQRSNEPDISYSFFFVVATVDSTRVEITPSKNTKGGRSAGVPFDTLLMRGEVYNVMSLDDLTGSKIRSISAGNQGCKKIAVFSGTGKIQITCGTGQNTSDNVIQQAFPASAWGKNYLTVPTLDMNNNIYRVCVKDPSTVVKKNGLVLSGLTAGFYYEFQSNQPEHIEADKPVMVAQYVTTQSQCGNNFIGQDGDPEMIYLSPVEQTLDEITLNSTPNFNITHHYINVIIKTSAINSFTLDGNKYSTSFKTHPSEPDYSYAQIIVNSGQHRLNADSGFTAIAYGWGQFESYGYNAGANVIDLYQYVTTQNAYATIRSPVACKSSPFKLSLTLPYQPTSLVWEITGYPVVYDFAPAHDSTFMVNDRQLYRYTLPDLYVYDAIGNYPVKVSAINPTPDGCSGLQEIFFDLEVYDQPVFDFAWTNNGCVTDSVAFRDSSIITGRPIVKYFWDFGDGTTASIKSPKHLYANPGTYDVKFAALTDVGCLSDTVTRQVTITKVPEAKFGISSPGCIGRNITFTDSSIANGSALTKWYWNTGDNNAVTNSNNNPLVHGFSNTGSYTATLQVETAGGCKSNLYSKSFAISPVPEAEFILPEVCLTDAYAEFKDSSFIAGNSSPFVYLWNFGDGNADAANPNSSVLKDPRHKYSATGIYDVTLVVTSDKGCADTLTKAFTVNGDIPKSDFAVLNDAKLCSNMPVEIQNNSSVNFGTVTKLEIYWDWANDPSVMDIDDVPVDGKKYTHLYTDFQSPLTKTFQVRVLAYSGISCVDEEIKTITVNASPLTAFNSIAFVCFNEPPFQVMEAAETGGLPGTGTFTGPGVSSTGLFDPSLAGVGLHTIRYTFTADNGCSTYSESVVEVKALPSIDAGPDLTVLEGGSKTIGATATGPANEYLWTPPTYLDDATILNPTVNDPKDDIVYTLVATNEDGCKASDQVAVKVLKALKIPNTFTPNGDGINDKWEIRYLDQYPGAIIEVYNTAGQLMFRSVGYNNPWDGTYKGQKLPAGTYYYVIDPKNERRKMAGYVTILR